MSTATVTALERGIEHQVPVPVAMDPDWEEAGVCAQTDPEVFFPERGQTTTEAKRVCQNCTVRIECLVKVLNDNDEHGVRGGFSGRQRRKLRTDPAALAAVLDELAAERDNT